MRGLDGRETITFFHSRLRSKTGGTRTLQTRIDDERLLIAMEGRLNPSCGPACLKRWSHHAVFYLTINQIASIQFMATRQTVPHQLIALISKVRVR